MIPSEVVVRSLNFTQELWPHRGLNELLTPGANRGIQIHSGLPLQGAKIVAIAAAIGPSKDAHTKDKNLKEHMRPTWET